MDLDQETYQGYLISGLPCPYSWALNSLQEEKDISEIAQELGVSTEKALHIVNLALDFLDDIRDQEQKSHSYRRLLDGV